MNKEILHIIAEIATGGPLESRFINWAVKKLLNGQETPSIILLAGLSQSEKDDAIELFLKSIGELGYSIPSKEDIFKAFITKEVVTIAKEFLENKIDVIKASDLISSYKYDIDPDWNDDDLTSFWLISDDFSNYRTPLELMGENYKQKQIKAREELLAICTFDAIKAAKNIVEKYKELL